MILAVALLILAPVLHPSITLAYVQDLPRIDMTLTNLKLEVQSLTLKVRRLETELETLKKSGGSGNVNQPKSEPDTLKQTPGPDEVSQLRTELEALRKQSESDRSAVEDKISKLRNDLDSELTNLRLELEKQRSSR